MKLHQAWAVTRISALAGALSMTACTAASSDVAVDGEHAAPTGEALQARDQGAGPNQGVSQGQAGNESRSQGSQGTSRRGNHGTSRRHDGGVSQGKGSNESRSQGSQGTSQSRNHGHGTRHNASVNQGQAGNESRSQGSQGTSQSRNHGHGTRHNRSANQGKAGKTNPSMADNDPIMTAIADEDLHSEPDSSSEVVGPISVGDVVNVACSTPGENNTLGVSEIWYQLDDGTYVISSALDGDLSEVDDCDTGPSVIVTLTAAPAEGSTVDVFRRPNQNAELVSTIDRDSDIDVECSDVVGSDIWYRLPEGGGYVNANDVSGPTEDVSACTDEG